jgi:hypothetical protein
MLQLRCTYLRDTGFRDGQSWEPGTVLQFVYASHKAAYGIVLPDVGSQPILCDLADIRIDAAAVAVTNGDRG